MRTIYLTLAALVAGALATPAVAAPSYPWCARYSSTGGECSFQTFAQCQQDVSGIGGFCQRNASFKSSAAKSPAYAYAPLRGSRRR